MFEDVIKAISQMQKMNQQSERDKMNEHLKVGLIQDVPPLPPSEDVIKEERISMFVSSFCYLPVFAEPSRILHIGMDLCEETVPVSRWQRFKNLFKRKKK